MVRPAMNAREAAVDRSLARYAQENGYRIAMKMRLRDVIDADDDWLDVRERNFLFMAHLDFVVLDESTHLPVLAVEYDGPQHSDLLQAERDRIKDWLCEKAGLPMLRIDNHFARKEGRWQVLEYILWAHEMSKAFCAAQKAGYVPYDEPFDPHFFLLPTKDPDQYEFSGLSQRAISYLCGFRERQVRWESTWWRGDDLSVEVRALACLVNGQYLSAQCAVRNFAIEGISALDIASDLTITELAWHARRYNRGEAVALSAEQGAAVQAEIGDPEAHTFNRTATGWHLSSAYHKTPEHP